jgi:membrane-associated phospholipid phosphatase
MFSLFAFTFPLALDPIRDEDLWNFVFFIFFLTFVLPALNMGFFKAFGRIKSYAMEEKNERIMPFTFIAILYCMVTYLFYSRTQVSLSDNFLKFMIIIDALVVLATVVTIFYKISVHSLAIWGFIGILFPLHKVTDSGVLFYPLLISIVLAGVIMSARLRLNVHTPREVMVGGMLGFAMSFICMNILF